MSKRQAVCLLIVVALLLSAAVWWRSTNAQPEPIPEPERDWGGLKVQQTVSPSEPTPEPSQAPVKQEKPAAPRAENAVVSEPQIPGQVNPEIPLSGELQAALAVACDKYGVDYAIALALIQTESNFDPYVVSYSGCYGLCQLNPYYFPSGLSPAENINYGMQYLGTNLAKYGNYPAALCAYNNGHDNGDRGYANVVLSRAEYWRTVI